jgi:asparaginyl-tRNA synthetase
MGKLDDLLKETLAKSEARITKISDLSKHVGKEVYIRGWVHRQRGSTNLCFVILRDGTGIAQCAVKSEDV